jgi:MscS family membrane protein
MTPRIAIALVAALLAIGARPGAAVEPGPPTSTTASAATSTTAPGEEETEDVGFTSPRSTMRGFLAACRAGDYEKAAEHLDLRRLPKAQRTASGALFARELRTVLDRTLWVEPDTLSDSPDGERDDGLPARRELVGTIRTTKGPFDVVLERVPEPDGSLAWKIASSVVAQIPELYAEFGDGPFATLLPEFLLETEVFAVRLWQWMGLLVLLGAGALVAWLASGPLVRLLAVVVPEDRRHQSQRLLAGLRSPLRLLVTIVVVTAGVPWLGLSVPAAASFALVRKTATTVVGTWLWLRIVDSVAAIADDRLRIHGRAGAVSVIPLGRRAFKIFVAIIAAIVIVQNLGYDATGILAGLGVGGLALALAAQKTVENLFGGVMLITDQPVRVGDVCRFGNRTGVVEDIGLRSTRIRTMERTIVSVPNAEFSSTQIENLSVRDRMQLAATIGLHLETTTVQLRAALEALRTLLETTPRIDRGSASVRFVGIAPAALEVQVQGYVLTRDWNEFLAVREDLYLKMLDALDQAGIGLAGRASVPPAHSA